MTITRQNNYIYLKRFAEHLDTACGMLYPNGTTLTNDDDGTKLLIKPRGMIAQLFDKDGNVLASLQISSDHHCVWYKETGMEDFVVCNPEILDLAYECDRESRAKEQESRAKG